MPRRATLALIALAGLLLAEGQAASAKPKRTYRRFDGEVHLTNEEFKQLDRFEAHALEKADKAFSERSYRQAAAEYESFLREFPRSLALPYVLLRKGRCLHKDDKRNVAIRQYNEVLDYFPDAVEYAAAALYYQGLAHWENGDEDTAMKHWARMARDKEYRKHALAAGAINKLADHLTAQGHGESAVTYFRQVAVDFRLANPQAAYYARQQVLAHLIRTSPNEPKLREFYSDFRAIRGLNLSPEDLAKRFEYWDDVRQKVVYFGRFAQDQAELRRSYYAHWAKQLGGKFLDHDDYQLSVAALHLAADGDAAAWARRLDEQFARGDTNDYGRVVKWIAAFAGRQAKAMEFYNRLDFSKMTNAQIASLVRSLFDGAGDAKMARNAFGKLKLAKMPDDEKAELARYLWEKDFDLARQLCTSMRDADRGRYELLLYYHARRDAKNGIPLADHLIGVPQYAAQALWKKAELLESAAKYAEAIGVYRQVTDQPANLWRIGGCYEKMGQVDQAVKLLGEVESFFPQHRAQAAIRIAQVYKRAKLQDKCVAAYRRVLVKYPDSPESSEAHHQLEEMDVQRIRGGLREGKERP